MKDLFDGTVIVMKEIIKETLLIENGLLLMDIPTGMGKTYDVQEVMLDLLEEMNESSRPIFFITNLTKNLPVKEFRKKAESRGLAELFDKYVLHLGSMEKMVENNFLSIANEIPYEIQQMNEYKKLFRLLVFIKENEHSGLDLSVQKEQIPRLERDFRGVVMTKLNEFGDVETKLAMIEKNIQWQWVGKIYPSVFTKRRKIFFLSIDKFFLGNPTLVEPTYQFINKLEFEKSIIFIDEFDASKDSIINQLIMQSSTNSVNLLTLFCEIHDFLEHSEFRTDIVGETGEKIVSRIKAIFKDNYQKYCKYRFKTVDSLDGQELRSFLFNDGEYLQMKNVNLYYYSDDKAKINWITNENPDKQYTSMREVLGSLTGAIHFFINGLTQIVGSYFKSATSNKRGLTYANCLTSVLNFMDLKKESVDYLYKRILEIQTEGKTKNIVPNQELAVKNLYSRGFRLYSLDDGVNNAFHTEVVFYQIPFFPEYYLYELCSKNLVFGISATATVDSVLSNYDLDYMKTMLGDHYLTINPIQFDRLKKKHEELTAGYRQINIETIPMNHTDLNNYLNEKLDKKSAYNFINNHTKLMTDFYIERFTKMLDAIVQFIYDKNVQSMLILSTQLIKEDSEKINFDLFRAALAMFDRYTYDERVILENLFVTLDSQQFEQQKNKLQKRLENGEKLVIFSSYKTVGVGQNLQYRIPNNSKVIRINDRVSQMKDIDCLYLDNPTHLITRKMQEDLPIETIYQGIIQIEYLVTTGEITYNQAKYFISNYFKNKKRNVDTQLKSINNKALTILKQAIGRICRTSNKNPVIKLFIDNTILDAYNFVDFKSKINNPEFSALLESGKSLDRNLTQELAYFQNKAVNYTLRFKNKLYQFIQSQQSWTTEQINRWRELRQFVLKYPTISEIDYQKINPNYQSLYIQLPFKGKFYSFTQKDDFSELNIFFDHHGKSRVSEQAVRLEYIREVAGLAEYFKDNEFALAFKEAEYMLSPVAFQNIYKGALGEIIGQWVFNNYLHFPLEEMPVEQYEKFDFHIQNKIFIDFKYWNEINKQLAKESIQQVQHKLDEVNGKKAIIINIFANRSYQISTSNHHRVVEIPYLFKQNTLDSTILQQLVQIIKEGLEDDNFNQSINYSL